MSREQHESAKLSAEVRARVFDEIARVPSPTRRDRRVFIALVASAALVALALTFFATGGIEPGTRPATLIVFSTGLGLMIAATLTTSVARSGSMLGPPSRTLLFVSILAPLAWLVSIIAVAEYSPLAAAEPVSTHLGCALLTLVQGALPLAAFVIAKRRTDPLHPGLTGFALGITAGAWAVTFACLRCPHVDAVHGIATHALPALLLGVAGALLGRAVLALR